MKTSQSQQEGTVATATAILLMFTSVIDPRISVAIAVGLLLAFAMYKFMQKK